MQKLSITQFLWVTKSLGLTLKKIPLVMKLFFVFMLSSISFLHASDSYAQTARISLDIKNQTVQEVLEQIEAESDFSFFYNDRHVDLNRKVSVSVNDTDIFKILEAVFSGTNVGYSVVENRIVLSIKSSNPVIAQKEKKITGTVVDLNEAKAIAEVFEGHHPYVTSTKSMTGHEMWMAGASEVIYSTLMMNNGFIAPNLNFEEPDEASAQLNIPTQRVNLEFDTFLSNSFGFGGTNSTLIIRQIKE